MSKKICASCHDSSKKLDSIHRESTLTHQVPEWKRLRGERTLAPFDKLPFLENVWERYPVGYDTVVKVNLGKRYVNRVVYYFAAEKRDQIGIKKAPKAYNKYENSGIVFTDETGLASLKLKCPQPYKENGITYYPHVHFFVSNKNNKCWDHTVRTVNVICNFQKQKLKKIIKEKNFILLNALPNKYYLQDHIPNSFNLPVAKAKKMNEKDIIKFLKEIVPFYPPILAAYKKIKKVKDLPILVYCYSKNCGAGKKLIQRLFELGFRNIVEYEDGMEGYREK